MKNKTAFFNSSIALSALFILGDAIINLPLNSANEYTFLGYLFACCLAAVLYLLAIPVSSVLFGEKNTADTTLKKFIFCPLYTAIALISLKYAADTFLNFANFANEVILPEIPIIFIILPFLAALIFFLFKRQEDILKFCLIAFVFALISIIFFSIACFKNLNFRNIFIFKLPSFGNLYKVSKPFIKNPVLESLLLPVYFTIVFKKSSFCKAYSGLLWGVMILGICILTSLTLFGAQFAGKLPFPYSSAISTVTIGRLFTRMDGFSYFIYFASAITKITVCLFVLKNCLKRIKFMQ